MVDIMRKLKLEADELEHERKEKAKLKNAFESLSVELKKAQ